MAASTVETSAKTKEDVSNSKSAPKITNKTEFVKSMTMAQVGILFILTPICLD